MHYTISVFDIRYKSKKKKIYNINKIKVNYYKI